MIEWFLILPSWLKLGVSFLGILLLNRCCFNLGLSILLFSAVLSIWSGAGMAGLYFQLENFALPENYLLPIVIVLLLLLVEVLGKTGRLARTVGSLKEMFKNRKTLLAGLPALVGMLPMPGGALFSAPLVASVDDENDMPALEKAAVNYWFRHIWEYWWPMYPGVILAMRFSGLSFTKFMLLQFPFTIVSLAGGYFFILRKGAVKDSVTKAELKGKKGDLFSALGPIFLLVLMTIMGSSGLSGVGVSKTVASLLAMLAGIVLAISLSLRGNIHALAQSAGIFRQRSLWLMLLLIISVQIFSIVLKCPLDHAGNNIVAGMRDEFVRAGIPVVLIIIMVPFISGLATGVAFGFVGASFPIVFTMIGHNPASGAVASATVLAYSSGYIGMMLSPLHVCFAVTCEYFGTRMSSIYRYIAVPSLLIFLTGLTLAGLYLTFL
jgi:integral membrane protein (TIGR00529 family)